MENVIWTAGRENGKFFADITDYYNNERVIITAKTKYQFIDLLGTEWAKHSLDECRCSSCGNYRGAMHEQKMEEILIHIIECTRFPKSFLIDADGE